MRGGGIGLRQHRDADQPVRGGGAELHQPIVVDAVAGLAQHRVVGRDLEDRAEDDLRLDAVAVHVLEAQIGDRRAPFALIEDAAAIEGVVDRLDGARVACLRRLAAPNPPDLAVADPHGLPDSLLDMRGAVAQICRKPRGPQIGRQLAEIHVVIAGDQLISHGVLQEMTGMARAPSRP